MHSSSASFSLFQPACFLKTVDVAYVRGGPFSLKGVHHAQRDGVTNENDKTIPFYFLTIYSVFIFSFFPSTFFDFFFRCVFHYFVFSHIKKKFVLLRRRMDVGRFYSCHPPFRKLDINVNCVDVKFSHVSPIRHTLVIIFHVSQTVVFVSKMRTNERANKISLLK